MNKTKILAIGEHDFEISNNQINCKEFINMNVNQYIKEFVMSCFNDYYLEDVYNYICKIPGSYKVMDGCEYLLRYTEKINLIIDNCCENPGKVLEFKILELFTLEDIKYMPYIIKLNRLVYKFKLINILINNNIEPTYRKNCYVYNFFSITFDKYDFSLNIELDNIDKVKIAQTNLTSIPNIETIDYNIYKISELVYEFYFKNLNYNIFDNIIAYLEKLM